MEFITSNYAPVMFGGLIIFLLLGFPVAFSLGACGLLFGFLGIELGVFPSSVMAWLPQRLIGIMANDTLLAVPFFTLMGLIMERSGMAEDLLDTVGQVFGPLRGGLALAVAFFLSLSSFQFTLGIAISGGAATLRSLLKNPIVVSLALALPVIFFDVHLPLWLSNTVDLVGGMVIPLMLLTLGVSLASIRLHHVASGLLIGGLRIVLGAGVGWGIGVLLNLDHLAHAVLVMQSAMPVAVFNYLLAVRANRSPEQVANVVMCSTVLSFVWLPFVLAGWM